MIEEQETFIFKTHKYNEQQKSFNVLTLNWLWIFEVSKYAISTHLSISDLNLFQEIIKVTSIELYKGPNIILYKNRYILEQIFIDYDKLFNKPLKEFNLIIIY